MFTREVYSVLEFLSDIGGLYGTVSVIVMFISGAYSSKVLGVEVVRSNFKLRPERN